MSFVFFDTETTGLSRAFDQIVHFSAIKTDNDLREVERFEVLSRLADYIVPHPQALSINGLEISDLLDRCRPSHYEMVRTIHNKLLAWSPAIFVGFNSMRFDEEMLRQAFYQTLHPPYLTSLHKNGRADARSLALMAADACSGSIAVALNAEGRGIFSLSELARANGIPHVAHNPVSDVEATISLCRLMQTSAPEVWQRFVRFSRKVSTVDFIDGGEPFVLTEFYASEAYRSSVVCIGKDPTQPTLRYCLVLNRGTSGLLTMSDQDLVLALRAKPSPVRKVRVNASPAMTPLYDVDVLPDLDHDKIEALALEVKTNVQACERFLRFYQTASLPFPAPQCAEEAIYSAFPSSEDAELMSRFHQVAWSERLAIVGRLQDERARCFGLRLIQAEAPEFLSPGLVQQVDDALRKRHYGGEKAALSIPDALREADHLLASLEPDAANHLREYRDYLAQRSA